MAPPPPIAIVVVGIAMSGIAMSGIAMSGIAIVVGGGIARVADGVVHDARAPRIEAANSRPSEVRATRWRSITRRAHRSTV